MLRQTMQGDIVITTLFESGIDSGEVLLGINLHIQFAVKREYRNTGCLKGRTRIKGKFKNSASMDSVPVPLLLVPVFRPAAPEEHH